MASAFFVHRNETNDTIVGGGFSLTTTKEGTNQQGGGDPEEAFTRWAVPSGLAVGGTKGGTKDSFDYEAYINDESDVAPDSYFGGSETKDTTPSFTESRKKRHQKKSTTTTKRRKQ